MRVTLALATVGFCLGLSLADTPPPFYHDKAKLFVYREAEGKEHPVKTAEDWAKRRQHILANMRLVMGPLPDDSRKVALDVQEIEEVKTEKFIRKKLTFAVEKGDRLYAYLFLPKERPGKLPAVLCLHPTSRDLGKGVPTGLGGQGRPPLRGPPRRARLRHARARLCELRRLQV